MISWRVSILFSTPTNDRVTFGIFSSEEDAAKAIESHSKTFDLVQISKFFIVRKFIDGIYKLEVDNVFGVYISTNDDCDDICVAQLVSAQRAIEIVDEFRTKIKIENRAPILNEK